MAISTVAVTGYVNSPDGVGLVSGTLTAKLSHPGSALDGATYQRVAGSIRVTLGTGGAIPSDLDLVPNEAITPANTYYLVDIGGVDADGKSQRWQEKWSLESSPSTIAIGAITRLDSVPSMSVTPAQDLASVLSRDSRTTVPVSQGGTGNATGDASALVVTPTGGVSGTVAAHIAAKLDRSGGDASAVNITPTGGAARTAAAIGADVQRAVPDWEQEPTPWIISHRGASTYFPENTLASFDECAGLHIPIETDVQLSSDGYAVLIHDTTVDRTTDGTGNVIDLTLAQLRALNASDYFGSGFPVTTIPTLYEYLGRYAGRHLLVPQAYTLAAGHVLAAAIRRAQATGSVVVQDFTSTNLPEYIDICPGLKCLALCNTGALLSVASLQSAGAWASGPDRADVTAQYVTDCHAAGINVITWVCDKVYDAERVIALGVDGLMSNDPGYIRLLRGTVTPSGVMTRPPPRLPAGGWAGSGSGTFQIVSGYATHSANATYHFVYPPVRLPAGSWQADVNLKLVAKAADTTRYIALRFCVKQDRDVQAFFVNGNSSYAFVLRGDGVAKIEKWVAVSQITTLATANWAAPSEGDVIPLRITVTPTAVTVLQTATDETVTVNNADLTRDGFIDALGSAASRVGLGTIEVTY